MDKRYVLVCIIGVGCTSAMMQEMPVTVSQQQRVDGCVVAGKATAVSLLTGEREKADASLAKALCSLDTSAHTEETSKILAHLRKKRSGIHYWLYGSA